MTKEQRVCSAAADSAGALDARVWLLPEPLARHLRGARQDQRSLEAVPKAAGDTGLLRAKDGPGAVGLAGSARTLRPHDHQYTVAQSGDRADANG